MTPAMFWRMHCCATILLALCCTSSTFWISSAEHHQQQPPHHGDHKLSDQEHYKPFLAHINKVEIVMTEEKMRKKTFQDSLKDAAFFLSKDQIFMEGADHDAKFDHEAFLGKDEAKEFDELTPEKSKERLAKLMPKMDLNGDGLIEENELREHISFMQKRYVNNDVERTWKNYKDEQVADGKLSWNDYRTLVYGKSQDGQEVAPEYARMIERDDRRWKVADYDSDGKLDRTEYGCFMHPEDCDHMRDIVVQETVEDIDKNKDGFVDMEEYIGDMYRPEDYPELNGKEPEWVESEREMFREHRDKDKDNKLNNDEMRDWVMPLNFDHADAEAKHLIHIADDDKDGKLSPEEVLAHYDTFVGSQATDYGEQLQKHDPADL